MRLPPDSDACNRFLVPSRDLNTAVGPSMPVALFAASAINARMACTNVTPFSMRIFSSAPSTSDAVSSLTATVIALRIKRLGAICAVPTPLASMAALRQR